MLAPGLIFGILRYVLKLISLMYFSLSFTLFELCGAVFIMNSKIHLRKNSLSEYFKAISHSVFIHSRALYRPLDERTRLFRCSPKVQVAVFSVLNLPRQGFLATCRIGHCCVCSHRLPKLSV